MLKYARQTRRAAECVEAGTSSPSCARFDDGERAPFTPFTGVYYNTRGGATRYSRLAGHRLEAMAQAVSDEDEDLSMRGAAMNYDDSSRKLLKPPTNMRMPSKGSFFASIMSCIRGSFITFSLMLSRSSRD